jgi:hypothetical protein
MTPPPKPNNDPKILTEKLYKNKVYIVLLSNFYSLF